MQAKGYFSLKQNVIFKFKRVLSLPQSWDFTLISLTEWIFQFICMGIVTGAEAINTAIEKLCDHVTPNNTQNKGVKIWLPLA